MSQLNQQGEKKVRRAAYIKISRLRRNRTQDKGLSSKNKLTQKAHQHFRVDGLYKWSGDTYFRTCSTIIGFKCLATVFRMGEARPFRKHRFVGLGALRDALKSWLGAMVVVSHDRDFIDTIGVSSEIRLGANGSNEPLRR